MKPGDVAGLALLNLPYAWIGVRRSADGLTLEQFDQFTNKSVTVPLASPRVSLRAHCDFLTEKAEFSYSTDGKTFTPIGDPFTLVFQLKTFQGVRYSLFHFNTNGAPGGYADFDSFTVAEPHPRGLMKPIPFGQTISLTNFRSETSIAVKSVHRFHVLDRGLGRVALGSDAGFLSVGDGSRVTLKSGPPGDAETFQWTENVYGDVNLLSLVTHRHVRIDAANGNVFADSPGPKPDRKDGSCFT